MWRERMFALIVTVEAALTVRGTTSHNPMSAGEIGGIVATGTVAPTRHLMTATEPTGAQHSHPPGQGQKQKQEGQPDDEAPIDEPGTMTAKRCAARAHGLVGPQIGPGIVPQRDQRIPPHAPLPVNARTSNTCRMVPKTSSSENGI